MGYWLWVIGYGLMVMGGSLLYIINKERARESRKRD